MKSCNRCDWQGHDLTQHAVDHDHPLCQVCGRISLPGHQPRTCTSCYTEASELLSGILTMATLLPAERGVLRGKATPGYVDGRPLPGGDVLTMLAPGSAGNRPRPLTMLDRATPERWWLLGAVGPLTSQQYLAAERARFGQEHQADNDLPYAPSVSYQLALWAREWNTVPRDLAARLKWAAVNLDLSGWLQEARAVHARLQQVLNLATVDPEQLDLECLALVPSDDPDVDVICGGPLVRKVRDVRARRLIRWWVLGAAGPLPKNDLVYLLREGLVVDPDDPIVCSRCGRRYDRTAQHLAEAEHARKRAHAVLDDELYATVQVVAHDLGRPVPTIRRWINDGLVRSWTSHGLRFVHVEDATAEHHKRATRKRKTG